MDSNADIADLTAGDGICGSAAPNTCTLRAAIQETNATPAADTIIIAGSLAGQTTTANLDGDYPAIAHPVTITGPSPRFTVSGSNAAAQPVGTHSLFRFTGSAGSYAISNLVITNARGNAVGTEGNGGGGIFFNPSAASSLALTGVDLTNNRAASTGGAPGGGLYVGAVHAVTVTGGAINGNHTAGDMSLSDSDGGGIFNEGTLTINGTTIGNNTAARGGAIFNSGTLTLGAQVTTPASLNGNTASGTGGGGIYNSNGTVRAADTVLDSNTVSGSAVGGGGIFSDINTGGATTLTRVTITNNSVTSGTGSGGGIYARKLLSSAEFSLLDCTLDSNTSSGGAGGGLFVKRGLVQIMRSTISNNTAANGSGGGIYLDEDGSGGQVAVINSTISGNAAAVGGGIGVNASNVAPSSLVHITLAKNNASVTNGGGGISYGLPTDGALNPDLIFPGAFGNPFTSNIIVKNTANSLLQNCRNGFSHNSANDSGYNVTDDASCGFTQDTDRTVAPTALLGALADNLGPTQTHGVLAGYPAIDHANPLYVTATDQRGALPQDGDQSGEVLRDAGAYEYGGFGVMEFEQSAYTVREDADTLTAVVKRFGNTGVETSVKVRTEDDSAKASDGDYNALPSQDVRFNTEDVREDVVVTINDDDVVEGGEQFSLELSEPQQGADLGPTKSAVVTITDVEEGEFQFAESAYAAHEGGTAAVNENSFVTITVTRASGSDKAVTVSYSVSGGTAVEGEDFVATSATGSLSWADGDSAPKTFDVQLIDDIEYEPGERTLQLTLADPPGRARIGSLATTTLTLTDDDVAVPGDFSLSSATYTAMEASVSLVVKVTRANGDDGVATVQCVAENGTAVAVTDFQFDANNPETLSWDDNEAGEKDCTFTLNDDSNVESNKTFTVKLASPTGGAGLGAISEAAVTLISDEQPQFRFNLTLTSGTQVQEGATGFQVAVEALNAVDGEPVTIAYFTADGTATASSMDYTGTTGSLTWNDGDGSTKTFSIGMIAADGVIEGNETFTVNLGAPAGGGQVVGNNPTTITILDPPAVRFKMATFSSVDEQDGSAIEACVERIGSPQGAVSVEYSVTDGSATEGTDYTPPPGTPMHVLSWANNDTVDRCFDITIIGDSVDEADETIALGLLNPSPGLLMGSPRFAQATITDDDAAPSVSLSLTPASLAEEGAGNSGTLTATLDGTTATADVVVNLVYGGTAVHGTDYTGAAAITVPAGQTSASITLTAVADLIDEGSGEDLTVTIDSVSANATIGAPSAISATVVDNDGSAIVTESAGSTAVTEGGATDSYTLVLGEQPAASVTIAINAGSQVTTSPTSATFTQANWNVAQTITVAAVNDLSAEGPHNATITHSASSADSGYNGIAVGSVNVSITDDDSAGVTVIESDGATAVTEGEATDTITVQLTSQPDADVTITVSASGQLMVTPATLTFTPADFATPQTVTVSAVDDDQIESQYTDSVAGTVASADPAYNGSLSPIAVVITDNDSAVAGENVPAVVVTYNGGSVNAAPVSGGGGALTWPALAGLLTLFGLRRRRALVTVLALAGLSTGASAQELSYDNADLRYLLVCVDDPSVDASGIALAGSWSVGKQLFVSASYSTVETDDFRVLGATGSSTTESIGLGVGWRRPIEAGLDLAGGISVVSAKAEGQGGFSGSTDDIGYGVEAGFRGRPMKSFEWGAALSNVAIFDDSATGFSVQALYHLGPRFSLAAGAGLGEDSTQFNLGVRYGFAKKQATVSASWRN